MLLVSYLNMARVYDEFQKVTSATNSDIVSQGAGFSKNLLF